MSTTMFVRGLLRAGRLRRGMKVGSRDGEGGMKRNISPDRWVTGRFPFNVDLEAYSWIAWFWVVLSKLRRACLLVID